MEDDAIAHHQDKQYPHGHKILDPHSKKDHHHSHHHHHHYGIHHFGAHNHHGTNHHTHHKHCHHGSHNPECRGGHHTTHHNGRHHHGSHISKILYHSQKPHTDTIAEVAETNTTDEAVPLNANVTTKNPNNGKNTCVSKCSKSNVPSSKVRSVPVNDGSRRASSSIGIPNRNDHLPDISSLITLESAVTSPLYADEPVLDTNHRDLTVRDVEDILGSSPRTRGIFSGKFSGTSGTSPSKSPHCPKYKLEDIIDDVSLDIGTPWREETVPMIDFKNNRPVDRYDSNFLFQSVH